MDFFHSINFDISQQELNSLMMAAFHLREGHPIEHAVSLSRFIHAGKGP